MVWNVGPLQQFDGHHEKKGSGYTFEELQRYEEEADTFYQKWIVLTTGQHGMTNYIHMIGASHMLEYMKKWGNLTKYSQQRWEALNALINFFLLPDKQRWR